MKHFAFRSVHMIFNKLQKGSSALFQRVGALVLQPCQANNCLSCSPHCVTLVLLTGTNLAYAVMFVGELLEGNLVDSVEMYL